MTRSAVALRDVTCREVVPREEPSFVALNVAMRSVATR